MKILGSKNYALVRSLIPDHILLESDRNWKNVSNLSLKQMAAMIHIQHMLSM